MKKYLLFLILLLVYSICFGGDGYKKTNGKLLYSPSIDDAGNLVITEVISSSVVVKTLFVCSRTWAVVFSSPTELVTTSTDTVPAFYMTYYVITSTMTGTIWTNTNNNRTASQSFPLQFPDQIIYERNYKGNRYLRLVEGYVGSIVVNVEINYSNKW